MVIDLRHTVLFAIAILCLGCLGGEKKQADRAPATTIATIPDSPGLECIPPMIAIGPGQCCKDANDNKLCDEEESPATTVKPPAEPVRVPDTTLSAATTTIKPVATTLRPTSTTLSQDTGDEDVATTTTLESTTTTTVYQMTESDFAGPGLECLPPMIAIGPGQCCMDEDNDKECDEMTSQPGLECLPPMMEIGLGQCCMDADGDKECD